MAFQNPAAVLQDLCADSLEDEAIRFLFLCLEDDAGASHNTCSEEFTELLLDVDRRCRARGGRALAISTWPLLHMDSPDGGNPEPLPRFDSIADAIHALDLRAALAAPRAKGTLLARLDDFLLQTGARYFLRGVNEAFHQAEESDNEPQPERRHQLDLRTGLRLIIALPAERQPNHNLATDLMDTLTRFAFGAPGAAAEHAAGLRQLYERIRPQLLGDLSRAAEYRN